MTAPLAEQPAAPARAHQYHESSANPALICLKSFEEVIYKRRHMWTALGLLGILMGSILLAIALVQQQDAKNDHDANRVPGYDPIYGCLRGGSSLDCHGEYNNIQPTASPTRGVFSNNSTMLEPTTSPDVPPSLRPSTWESSLRPSIVPSLDPTEDPTRTPSNQPSILPTLYPSSEPTHDPTNPPTAMPSNKPLPTLFPTFAPIFSAPSDTPTRVAFFPGQLTVAENGLLLSTGLTSRILAVTGQAVRYDNGGQSSQLFHRLPDFGGTFEDPHNPGGWIYVSNSEVRPENGILGRGGVGALRFDANGQLVEYQSILQGTTSNCGGGKTPWGAWISCEEYGRGRAWQVDPTGEREPQVITLGSDRGVFESFACDVRNRDDPAFFITEDHEQGALQRFRPDAPDWNDPWSILLGTGTIDFLVLTPDSTGNGGTFAWTLDRESARRSAANYYPNSEGIDVYGGQLYFISKRYHTMITLNLDVGTYVVESTRSGLFNGGPDQIKRILNDDSSLLFFTEDGSASAGIHARNEQGHYLTILDGPAYEAETTGLAFSPDYKAMYVAYQVDGLLFEIRREDGLPFYGRSLNVHYHAGATFEVR